MSLTFTLLDEGLQDTLLDAVNVSKISRWTHLQIFLQQSGIDTKQHSKEKWMEFLSAARDETEELKQSAMKLKHQRELKKAAREIPEQNSPEQGAEQDSSTRQERANSRDSGRDSALGGSISSDNDRPDTGFFLVSLSDDFPDGKVSFVCSYSEDDDQNYITETFARRRLKVCEGTDGKVALTLVRFPDGQSEVRKFNIVEDEVLDKDIRLGMKRPEEIQHLPIDTGDDQEAVSEMGLVRTNSARHTERSRSKDRTEILAIAIGVAYPNIKAVDKDVPSEGARLGVFVDAAVEAFHLEQRRRG